jgi:hypothetical protein
MSDILVVKLGGTTLSEQSQVLREVAAVGGPDGAPDRLLR